MCLKRLKTHGAVNIMNKSLLSKKQQKKALSGKKTSAKGLRNVLAQPYEFFWPIIQKDNVEELKLLLETSMPAIRRTSSEIPWAQLQRMKKTERQAARKEARLKQDVPQPDENILNSVVMGVNAVTRLLEKGGASCILLEANVEPMLLIKHIVSMADSKNIAVILVPSLKRVMLETIGFACAAIALKTTVGQLEDHHFHNLFKKVVEVAANFKKHRPLELDFKEDTVEEILIVPEKSCDEGKVRSNELFVLSTDVYKYRNSRTERVFVPQNATGSEVIAQKLDGDFISIGKDSDFAVSHTGPMKYRPKARYIDIHKEDEEMSSETKEDNMQLNEYISTHSNPKSSGSPSDQESAIDSEVLYKTKANTQGISKKSQIILNSKNEEPTKRMKYESLKVKRLQGNSKRVKATKVPKKKKK